MSNKDSNTNNQEGFSKVSLNWYKPTYGKPFITPYK